MTKERNTRVDIEYSISMDYNDSKLRHIPGFTEFLGDINIEGERKVATFELDSKGESLTKEQEEAVKEILGTNLRQIRCYRPLEYKFYK